LTEPWTPIPGDVGFYTIAGRVGGWVNFGQAIIRDACLDYAALGLWHYGIRAPWLRRRIQDSGHMICSQMTDHLLCKVGFHLFDDGRLPQDVTPGAIYYATDPRVT
jgi:hypothetical protein